MSDSYHGAHLIADLAGIPQETITIITSIQWTRGVVSELGNGKNALWLFDKSYKMEGLDKTLKAVKTLSGIADVIPLTSDSDVLGHEFVNQWKALIDFTKEMVPTYREGDDVSKYLAKLRVSMFLFDSVKALVEDGGPSF